MSTSSHFTGGDLVMLRSGGPIMTVSRNYLGTNGWVAVCQWFDSGQLREHEIIMTSLRKAKHVVNE